MVVLQMLNLIWPRLKVDAWSTPNIRSMGGALGIEVRSLNCDECEETGLKTDTDGTEIECGCEHTDFMKKFVENQKKWKELLDPQG